MPALIQPDVDIDGIVRSVVDRAMRGMNQTITSTPVVQTAAVESKPVVPAGPKMEKTIAIGSDHGGFKMKTGLIKFLSELGYQVVDCGTNNESDAVDYPDFALAVAKMVNAGTAWRGIVVDGAGIGSCMAANKVPGVRAALCYDISSAINSREHNDANVLTLGSGLIGESLAKQIAKTWLETNFGGGRHMRRIEKIISIEKTYMIGK